MTTNSLAKTSQALATPTDLAPNAISSVGPALNALLADFFTLYLKTKNFHWHVSGPHFRDYHLLLDDQATQVFASTDDIAERARKIGYPALRSIGDIQRHQRLADNNAEFVPAIEMIKELRDDNLAIVKSLRELKKLADEADDNATSSLVDNWTDDAEQRAWFLFEITR
jgi:starvation-inducible DNA-binding protein